MRLLSDEEIDKIRDEWEYDHINMTGAGRFNTRLCLAQAKITLHSIIDYLKSQGIENYNGTGKWLVDLDTSSMV